MWGRSKELAYYPRHSLATDVEVYFRRPTIALLSRPRKIQYIVEYHLQY